MRTAPTAIIAALLTLTAAAPASARSPRLTVGQAHRLVHRHYDPASDDFHSYRIAHCRHRSRTLVDCDLILSRPDQGGTICQPNPDDPTELVCETSTPLPSDTQVQVTVRVHNRHVWEVIE